MRKEKTINSNKREVALFIYPARRVKVRLKDGTEEWLLIHVEVQGTHEEDFDRRMFRYFYRLYWNRSRTALKKRRITNRFRDC